MESALLPSRPPRRHSPSSTNLALLQSRTRALSQSTGFSMPPCHHWFKSGGGHTSQTSKFFSVPKWQLPENRKLRTRDLASERNCSADSEQNPARIGSLNEQNQQCGPPASASSNTWHTAAPHSQPLQQLTEWALGTIMNLAMASNVFWNLSSLPLNHLGLYSSAGIRFTAQLCRGGVKDRIPRGSLPPPSTPHICSPCQRIGVGV